LTGIFLPIFKSRYAVKISLYVLRGGTNWLLRVFPSADYLKSSIKKSVLLTPFISKKYGPPDFSPPIPAVHRQSSGLIENDYAATLREYIFTYSLMQMV
jgi:hypothetical protein